MTRIVFPREINGVTFRIATLADSAAIEEVMKASARDLSRGFYAEHAIPSVERFIATLDSTLVEDGTYFVGEVFAAALSGASERAARVAACGGWSRRDKLFTGVGEHAGGARLLDPAKDPARVRAMFVHPDFARRGLGRAILDLCEEAARAENFRRLELMATLPGEPLYAACGFTVIERVTITLPDGIQVGGARMEKTLGPG
jgi:GNAT superfamily N-acetyltransferase